MKKLPQQKVIEDFLNDSVEKVGNSVYKWGKRYYEVLPYHSTIKRHNWSGFVRHERGGKTWAIREASNEVIAKYYPKIWARLEISQATHLNKNLIQRIDL